MFGDFWVTCHSMRENMGICWLNALLVALLSLSLALLAYGHQTDRTVPLAYAPDGTVAVLCLAGDAPTDAGHDMPRCEACRILLAAIASDPVPYIGSVDWRGVDAPVLAAVANLSTARDATRLARAPPA